MSAARRPPRRLGRTGGGGAAMHLPAGRCRRARHQGRAPGRRLRPRLRSRRARRERQFRLAQPRQAVGGARSDEGRRQGAARSHARARPTCSCRTSNPARSPSSALPSSALRQDYPRLICCSISGYGESGPYAQRKAYDLLIQAESGVSSVTGGPEGPARVGVSIVDIAAGLNAYEAILEALIARGSSGEGAEISVSMFDAMAEWMTVPLLHAEGGAPFKRIGLAHAAIAPYGVFKTPRRRRHPDRHPERPRMARAGGQSAGRCRARHRSRNSPPIRSACEHRARNRRARGGGVRAPRRRAADGNAGGRRHRLCPRQRFGCCCRRIRICGASRSARRAGRSRRRRRRRCARAKSAATARSRRWASTPTRCARNFCRRAERSGHGPRLRPNAVQAVAAASSARTATAT